MGWEKYLGACVPCRDLGSQLGDVWVEALTFRKIVQSLIKFYPSPLYLQNVLFLLLRTN